MDLLRPILTGPDARAAERGLAWTRLVACAYGAWQLATDTQGLDAAPLLGLWALMVLYAVAAAVVLRRPAGRPIDRVMQATFALDAVVITSAGLLAALVPTDLTYFAIVAVPVLGGLKFGLRGAGVGLGVLVVEELVRITIRAGTTNPADPGQVALVLILGLTVGGATGWLSELQAHAVEDANAQAADLRRSTRGHEAILRVLRAGIASGERAVARHVVDELRGTLGEDVLIGAVIAPLHGGSLEAVVPAELAQWGTDVQAEVMIDPDGPLQLAMMTGQAQRPSPATVRRLTRLRPETTAMLIQPMIAQGRILGCLVAEACHPETFDDDDLAAHLADLADAVALVLSAAVAYDQEAAVAERHRHLDRMKTDFVAITSHELRTPITAILGFAQTMERTDVELGRERRLSMVASISRQARRLAGLVDDLGTVSAMDAGTLTVVPGRTSLDEVVAGCIEAFDGVDIHTAGQVGVKLWCDKGRLAQVLTNLLRNAVEHGRAPIDVTWTTKGGFLHLRVGDHGSGVPADSREEVFERFVQLDPAEGHQRGSGLGLFISRQLARAMGGELALLPDGPGATFEVRVPLDDD